MKLEPKTLYHIFNRGNNRQAIFLNQGNYPFFLSKVQKQILPYVDLLAYCLMPNHFHLLIYTPEEFDATSFHRNYRLLLSSYTRAINNQYSRSGSLFQQHSKAKELNTGDSHYSITCFHYIHQNPIKANLVDRMEDWKYSSFHDYMDNRPIKLCNTNLARELLDISANSQEFYKNSHCVIPINSISFD